MKISSQQLVNLRSRINADNLRIAEFMNPKPLTLSPENSLADLGHLLNEKQIRHTPLVDSQNKLVGLVTHRDLIRALAASTKSKATSSRTLKLKHVMHSDIMGAIKTIEPHKSLREGAIHMAEAKFGCLPVVNKEGQLLGIITESDFVLIFANKTRNQQMKLKTTAFENSKDSIAKENLNVKDMMTDEVFSIQRNCSLGEADTLMRRKNIRHIPITDEHNHLVGLISHRDLLRYAVSELSEISRIDRNILYRDILVGELMHKPVQTVTPNTSLRTAAILMAEKKLGCLPVIQDDKLVGIITEGDFLAFFADGI